MARQKLEPEVQAGLLWAVLLFAALVGLSRAFVKEEESGTVHLLRLSCPAQAVLWGKAAFNLALVVHAVGGGADFHGDDRRSATRISGRCS